MPAPYRANEGETLRLEHALHGVHTTYLLTKTHLAVEWRQDGSSGRSEHALRDLSPDVDFYEGRSAGAEKHLPRAVIALSLSVVVYFSSLQDHVPLLAGWLVVFGLHALWSARRAMGVSKWTVIRGRDRATIATIDHGGCDATDLARVLDALRERIRAERSLLDPGTPDARA